MLGTWSESYSWSLKWNPGFLKEKQTKPFFKVARILCFGKSPKKFETAKNN